MRLRQLISTLTETIFVAMLMGISLHGANQLVETSTNYLVDSFMILSQLVAALYLQVIVHELGHCFVARIHSIEVRGVKLFGVSIISSEPNRRYPGTPSSYVAISITPACNAIRLKQFFLGGFVANALVSFVSFGIFILIQPILAWSYWAFPSVFLWGIALGGLICMIGTYMPFFGESDGDKLRALNKDPDGYVAALIGSDVGWKLSAIAPDEWDEEDLATLAKYTPELYLLHRLGQHRTRRDWDKVKEAAQSLEVSDKSSRLFVTNCIVRSLVASLIEEDLDLARELLNRTELPEESEDRILPVLGINAHKLPRTVLLHEIDQEKLRYQKTFKDPYLRTNYFAFVDDMFSEEFKRKVIHEARHDRPYIISLQHGDK